MFCYPFISYYLQISGMVLMFRKSLTLLHPFEMNGWEWRVARADEKRDPPVSPQQNGLFLDIISPPKGYSYRSSSKSQNIDNTSGNHSGLSMSDTNQSWEYEYKIQVSFETIMTGDLRGMEENSITCRSQEVCLDDT